MFIDFVNVENIAKQFGVTNNFHINKTYKLLILDNDLQHITPGGRTVILGWKE
jgi:hypothetical protein